MKRVLLAVVLGAAVGLALYASGAAGDGGGTINTTLGDQSSPVVSFYGKLTNPVNDPCPHGRTQTTGQLANDNVLLDLCKFMRTGIQVPVIPELDLSIPPCVPRQDGGPTGGLPSGSRSCFFD